MSVEGFSGSTRGGGEDGSVVHQCEAIIRLNNCGQCRIGGQRRLFQEMSTCRGDNRGQVDGGSRESSLKSGCQFSPHGFCDGGVSASVDANMHHD
jgi:hypothetical protein